MSSGSNSSHTYVHIFFSHKELEVFTFFQKNLYKTHTGVSHEKKHQTFLGSLSCNSRNLYVGHRCGQTSQPAIAGEFPLLFTGELYPTTE